MCFSENRNFLELLKYVEKCCTRDKENKGSVREIKLKLLNMCQAQGVNFIKW